MEPRKARLADTTTRRFKLYHNRPEDIQTAKPNDPAVLEKRTRYPSSVKHPINVTRVLVEGHNNAKIGRRIQKGDWLGFPIYTLTLEERATCADDCFMKVDCYGNSMHLSRRHRHGEELEYSLDVELHGLAKYHPDGFVVRLHVLGDFYSVPYVKLWHDWMDSLPNLHVYGYTHRHPWSEDTESAAIGEAIATLKYDHPERFRMRWSSEEPLPGGATVIRRSFEGPVIPEGHVCATYIDPDASCATCTMCWANAMRHKTIVFPLHGPLKAGVKSATPKTHRNNRRFGHVISET